MIFWKALALVVGAMPLVSATDAFPARTEAGIDPAVMPEVVQVRCLTSAGSAFYVGPTTLYTASHVISAEGCFIAGKPFEIAHQDGDFAILRVAEPAKHWLTVDCGGYVPGSTYTAWGFARALPTLTSVDSVFTGRFFRGYAALIGVFHVIPGQSGGPHVAKRAAVGIVNNYDHRNGVSGSIQLKDTAACSA